MRYNTRMIAVSGLIWEKENIDHIARHGVSQTEVEEVCHGSYVTLDAYDGRFLVIGLTKSGRALAIIIDPEPEEYVFYVVTARSADRKERKIYSDTKGEKL